jgi:hypothetical protein
MRAWLLLVLLVAACAKPAPAPVTAQPGPGGADEHVPDYAKRPYEPFWRVNAVSIAEREWRGFGSVVNDAPPGQDLPVEYRLDRKPGLWQRVGDYWWFGQSAYSKESGWTGRYNEYGSPYSGEPPAWSAAFISYVMRASGAGERFPYSPLHATYINAAARGEGVLRAERPQSYPPQQGDLICYGRARASNIRFDDLPAPSFLGHCDMVIQALPGQLVVIGGNVSAGVTMKHVPVTESGTLAGPDGRILDDRYPWFVVLRVLYDG